MNKFKSQPYHKNLEYLSFLEDCHSICNRIYMCRNITLDKKGIIKQLKKIDKLPSHKCFRDEDDTIEIILPEKDLQLGK
jgi:hypothetical protein